MTTGSRTDPAQARAELRQIIEGEIRRPAPAGVDALVERIRSKDGGQQIAAILLYGSCLRSGRSDGGILDLYCLVDDYGGFYGHRRMLAIGGALLPPNVVYETAETQHGTIHAKVAIMALSQFRRAVKRGSFQISIWARFCQPTSLVYARDATAFNEAREALVEAVITAAWWATRLSEASPVNPRRLWVDLFRATYAAELRAETADRAAAIYDHEAMRYERILAPALAAAGTDGRDRAAPPDATGPKWSWQTRRLVGKSLSIMRLLKAAFTFEDGVDYLCWKIERHSGIRLNPTPWQRRHPLLAGPFIAWSLWRRGTLR